MGNGGCHVRLHSRVYSQHTQSYDFIVISSLLVSKDIHFLPNLVNRTCILQLSLEFQWPGFGYKWLYWRLGGAYLIYIASSFPFNIWFCSPTWSIEFVWVYRDLASQHQRSICRTDWKITSMLQIPFNSSKKDEVVMWNLCYWMW